MPELLEQGLDEGQLSTGFASYSSLPSRSAVKFGERTFGTLRPISALCSAGITARVVTTSSTVVILEVCPVPRRCSKLYWRPQRLLRLKEEYMDRKVPLLEAD